jgi:hypothetical protein
MDWKSLGLIQHFEKFKIFKVEFKVTTHNLFNERSMSIIELF